MIKIKLYETKINQFKLFDLYLEDFKNELIIINLIKEGKFEYLHDNYQITKDDYQILIDLNNYSLKILLKNESYFDYDIIEKI